VHDPNARHEPPPAPEGLHEKSDVGLSGLVTFGVALMVGVAVVAVFIWLLFLAFRSLNTTVVRDYPLAPAGRPPAPQGPALQVKPREDMKALREQEERLLGTYGWVDQASGTVRIPIDEAMRRVLLMELPARTEVEGSAGQSGRPRDVSGGRPPGTER